MTPKKSPETTPLARAVTAEVRAGMARQRISGAKLAVAAGMSQNYLAKRLRDEAPLTIDDLFSICEVLDLDPGVVMDRAFRDSKRLDADLKSTEEKLLEIQARLESAGPDDDVRGLGNELVATIAKLRSLSRLLSPGVKGHAEKMFERYLNDAAGLTTPDIEQVPGDDALSVEEQAHSGIAMARRRSTAANERQETNR